MPGSKKLAQKIPRVVTFDIMRGFFLIAIIIDHIAFFPNLLDWWGMRGQLLVTTAEGFFLLSGIVLGIVRGAKLVDEPFRNVAKIVLKRALQLYVTYVVLVIAFTAIAWYFYPGNPDVKFGVMPDQSWWNLIIQTITFQYTYGWADYLRFYALFLAVSPLALWLLRRGQWYIVAGISALTWLFSPIDIVRMPWEQIEILQPIPWQLLFFVGLIIGFHWPAITAWWHKHRNVLVRFVAIPVIIVAIGTLCWNVFAVFGEKFIDEAWARELSYRAWELRTIEFHKEALTFERIALFMVWFWAAFFLIERFQKQIVRFAGWLLIPFGVNSLYVYTLHAVIVFFIHLYFKDTTLIANFLVTAGAIALIYAAIRTKFLMSIIPR